MNKRRIHRENSVRRTQRGNSALRDQSENSMRRTKSESSIRAIANFLPDKLAKNLRREFDNVFKDPRTTHEKRFMWDHWNLAGQYRMHRTPARDFFTDSCYTQLEKALVTFGQKNLGCHSISLPWLSYYTEGDEQKLHTDSPHGPWAFVLSITHWKNKTFSGGETLIAKPHLLNFWSEQNRTRGYEENDFFNEVAPHFNQLTLFDPRIPHGVRQVRGTYEPTESRIVIHGWFVNPEPYVVGPLTIEEATLSLDNALPNILKQVSVDPALSGTLTLNFTILKNGSVSKIDILTSNIVNDLGETPKEFINKLRREFINMKFPATNGKSELVLPLIFD